LACVESITTSNVSKGEDEKENGKEEEDGWKVDVNEGITSGTEKVGKEF